MSFKIISGGQTGVDRAALDVAIERNIPCGGWCPRDRQSDDGVIGDHYPLQCTDSADPAQRTERNVGDADATLIIARGELTGGSALTRRLAEQYGKPCIVVDPSKPDAATRIRAWIEDVSPQVLNLAGPRASADARIYDLTVDLLRSVFEFGNDNGGESVTPLTEDGATSETQTTRGDSFDAADGDRFRGAIELAFDYRGDVTITLAGGGRQIVGYVYDRDETDSLAASKLRVIPANGDPRITLRYDEISRIEFTGRDTAAGKSFETWVNRYIEKKLAGESANIDCDVQDQ